MSPGRELRSQMLHNVVKKKKTKERNRGLITLSKVRKLEKDWITIRTPFWALPLLLFTTIPSILSFHGGPYYGSVYQSHSESKLFTKTLKKKKKSGAHPSHCPQIASLMYSSQVPLQSPGLYSQEWKHRRVAQVLKSLPAFKSWPRHWPCVTPAQCSLVKWA